MYGALPIRIRTNHTAGFRSLGEGDELPAPLT